MRFFNTAGPIKSDIHYFIPPLNRVNQDELLQLIGAEKYFVLHAPRQTGKTSCLLALTEALNRSGQYRAVYANIEAAQAARENVEVGMRTILSAIAGRSKLILKDTLPNERMSALLS